MTVVRTEQEPGVWKITNFHRPFGLIYTGKAQTHYGPPEIILYESIRDNKEKIDSWSLGCILYELNTGTRAFSDLLSVMKVYFGQEPIPQVKPSSNPKNGPKAKELEVGNQKPAMLMWSSLPSFPDIYPSLIGEGPYKTVDSDIRINQVNRVLLASFDTNLATRPTVRQIGIQASANLVRSKLEEDKVSFLQA